MKTSKVKVEIDNDGNPQTYQICVRGYEKAIIAYTIIDKRGESDDRRE